MSQDEVGTLRALLAVLNRTQQHVAPELARRVFAEGLRNHFAALGATWAELSPSGRVHVEADGVPTPESVLLTLAQGSLEASTQLVARWRHDQTVRHLVVVERARAFTAVDRALMEVLSENTWLLGRAIEVESREHVTALPPRLRQTLSLLLEGSSEKQIAATLSLSSHTVHDYVKELYRRLDVSSRSELLATMLGRSGSARIHATP